MLPLNQWSTVWIRQLYQMNTMNVRVKDSYLVCLNPSSSCGFFVREIMNRRINYSVYHNERKITTLIYLTTLLPWSLCPFLRCLTDNAQTFSVSVGSICVPEQRCSTQNIEQFLKYYFSLCHIETFNLAEEKKRISLTVSPDCRA